MGDLDGAEVKLVITNKSFCESNRNVYGVQNNFLCLTPQYIYDSIEKGYSLPFQDYLINSEAFSSFGNSSGNLILYSLFYIIDELPYFS